MYNLAYQIVSHFLDGEHQCQTFLFNWVEQMFSSDHSSTQIVDCLLVSLIIILASNTPKE